MIDPKDLRFVKAFRERTVQAARRFEIRPNWFLDDNPRALPFASQASSRERLGNHSD
jgi:hypothetical protein